MKNLFIIMMFLFGGLITTSCNDCVTCEDCDSACTLDENELCEDDYGSEDEYDAAVALAEGLCDCDCD